MKEGGAATILQAPHPFLRPGGLLGPPGLGTPSGKESAAYRLGVSPTRRRYSPLAVDAKCLPW